MTAPTVAVIDLGTICTRLLVVGPAGEIRRSPITNMGAEVVTSGLLGADALARVGVALEAHRAEIDAANVDAVRVVATSAARAATDVDDLAALVLDIVGAPLEVIDGGSEGRLTFAGAVSDLAGPPDRPAVVIDIGGGSTEFAYGTAADGVLGVFSCEIGATRVTRAYFEHDPPWASELSAALSVIQLHLDDVRRELPTMMAALETATVIGVGGTITTVAAVERGIAGPDESVHRFELTRDAVEDVFRTLATESAADRAFNPGLPADRVGLIVGGCCVLVEAMRHLSIDTVVVSERDLLDGVAGELSADWQDR